MSKMSLESDVASGQPALLYARVSTPRQAREGHGLDSQESRGRDHAASIGCYVESTFSDDITGAGDFMKRPGMVALLNYLDAHPEKSYVVIFDDLKRFARDTEFHLRLRRELSKRNARVECPNFRFEDTPEGKFVETILAAESELEREQNKRQVQQKMRARVDKGYWCFNPGAGYKYDMVDGHGKMLVPDEPLASIVTEAFYGYADRRFEGVGGVQRFLESYPAYPRDRKGRVHIQRVIDLLKRPLYAGFITVPKWGIFFRPGKHARLVDVATWHKVQQRLKRDGRSPARKDIDSDFPLRGFVVCARCGKPMTAAWCKGRPRKYPYYWCKTEGCPERYKTITSERIEGDFSLLLQDLTPRPELFLMVREMLSDLWEQRRMSDRETAAEGEAQVRILERKIGQLMERIAVSDSTELTTAYETQIKRIAEEKARLRARVVACEQPIASFEETFRTAMVFLESPCNLWASEQLEDKKLAIRLAFSSELPYQRNVGFRTAEISLPFKALAAISPKKSGLVEPSGDDPLI
jgi:DNA invertase Pin-like site-specific DNA recombinase